MKSIRSSSCLLPAGVVMSVSLSGPTKAESGSFTSKVLPPVRWIRNGSNGLASNKSKMSLRFIWTTIVCSLSSRCCSPTDYVVGFSRPFVKMKRAVSRMAHAPSEFYYGLPWEAEILLTGQLLSSLVRHHAQNRIQHPIQMLTDIFCQETYHEAAVFLQ